MHDHVEIVAIGFPQPLESLLGFFDGVGVLTEFDQCIGAHDVNRRRTVVEAEQTRAQVTTADPFLELIEAGQQFVVTLDLGVGEAQRVPVGGAQRFFRGLFLGFDQTRELVESPGGRQRKMLVVGLRCQRHEQEAANAD